jgi:hypothetical protein
MLIGIVLVAVGIIALLVQLDVLAGSIWDYTWPVIIIVLGLGFVFGWRRRRSFWRHWYWPRDDEEKK